VTIQSADAHARSLGHDVDGNHHPVQSEDFFRCRQDLVVVSLGVRALGFRGRSVTFGGGVTLVSTLEVPKGPAGTDTVKNLLRDLTNGTSVTIILTGTTVPYMSEPPVSRV